MGIFKDSKASIGRPKLISKDKTLISATSPSRSLSSLIKKTDKNIKIEILENGYLIIDFTNVIGNKARVSKTNALKLASFINSVYKERKKK